MLLCDCPSCGRRELRGARSIVPMSGPAGTTFGVACRHCGTVVPASGRGPLTRPSRPRADLPAA